MPTVTGTLTDFGLADLSAYSPQIIFTPSGPAVNGSKLLATRPIVVIPTSTGAFTATLATTDDLRPATWYTVTVQWLDAAGGFVSKDFPGWRLFVPALGGTLSKLLDNQIAIAGPFVLWVSDDGLEPAASKSGDYIYYPTSGDLSRIL